MFIIGFSAVSFAQHPGKGRDLSDMPKEGIVIGKVIDVELNQPMEYASVVLFSKRDSSMVEGTVTNADGSFRMDQLPFGRFYLVANFISYEKTTIDNLRST